MPDVTLAAESWLPVPCYEGLYEVSDLGRVRSLTHKTSKGIRYGRLLKQSRLKNGYLRVGLYRNGSQATRTVHSLVAEAFIGPCPPGMEVCHGPQGQLANGRDNLRYGTRSENILDQVRHGTHHEAGVTHCPAMHEYTPENTAIEPDGRRRCKICKQETSRQFRLRNPGRDREQKHAWVERNREFVRIQNRERARVRRARTRQA
jgi:NUMOD4 motif/HNH endonuclease